jgi:hypothetical protein
MTKIKKFESFSNEDTLYVFDYDDTLVLTPDFEELAIDFLKENVTIESLLNMSIKTIGISLSDLKWQDGRIYVEDPNAKISVQNNDKNWVRKGARVYLLQPDEFGLSDMSLPTRATDLKSLYNSIQNKCIVTARPIQMREKVERSLGELGLDYPKYGVHMYPHVNHYRAGTWKGNKIVELIEKTEFSKVIFYDDNQKYIKAASKVVKEFLPDFDYTAIKFKYKND